MTALVPGLMVLGQMIGGGEWLEDFWSSVLHFILHSVPGSCDGFAVFITTASWLPQEHTASICIIEIDQLDLDTYSSPQHCVYL